VGAGVFSVVLAGAAFLGGMGSLVSGMGCGMGNIGSVGRGDCSRHERFVLVGLGSAAVLTSVGVTLIAIGNHKVPAPPEAAATASPWVGPESAGLSVRFAL
jgi:hypothetical protein